MGTLVGDLAYHLVKIPCLRLLLSTTFSINVCTFHGLNKQASKTPKAKAQNLYLKFKKKKYKNCGVKAWAVTRSIKSQLHQQEDLSFIPGTHKKPRF